MDDTMRWIDLKELIADVETLLDSVDNESRSLQTSKRYRQEIDHVISNRENDAKKIIQGLLFQQNIQHPSRRATNAHKRRRKRIPNFSSNT